MASRHHYSIPGASLLKPKSSSKAQVQSQKPASGNVASSSRDTRQPNSLRAHNAQEAVPRGGPPSRPPSVSGYRSQQPAAHVGGFPATGSLRQPPTQRPASATPQASSSKTRLDVPEPRNYFSKMFSRKSTPAVPRAEDRPKSSHKHQRSSSAQVPSAAYPAATMPNPPPTAPLPGWSGYESSSKARDSDREERSRQQKAREEWVRAERAKEERMRVEYAAYKARVDAEEAQAVAAATKAARSERPAVRPSREDRRAQEYESDTARRRQQAQQGSAYRQEARASFSQYLHPSYQVPTNVARTTVPARDAQQTPAPQPTPQPTLRNQSVPIQDTPSSQPFSAPNQVQPAYNTSAPTAPPILSTHPVLNQSHNQSQSQSQNQSRPRRPSTPPSAPNMLPMYLPPGADDRARLSREAAEREAYVSREREREREREKEKERERERGKEREKEKEDKRARRADREKQKELERAERERQKEVERAERVRQNQVEREEQERQEMERAERERQKELERVEKERLKTQEHAERQKEADRLDRERLREKEREREREYRSSSRRRSYRDKTQSLSVHPPPGATSSSETERLGWKDSRRRSQSHPAAVAADTQHAQPMVAPSETQRTESRKEATTAASIPTPAPAAVQNSALKPPDVLFSHIATETPALPVPPPLADRHDHVLYPRSGFVAHPQQVVHPKPFERSRTDPVPSDDAPNGSAHTTVPMSSWPQPPPPMPQSKLVSIYASQGPPDRTPSHSTQKLAGSMPAVEQMIPGSTPSTNNYEGYGRGMPRDRSSYHQQSTPTSALAPTSAAQQSSLFQAPSYPPSSRQSALLSQSPMPPPTNNANILSSTLPYNSQSRPDVFNPGLIERTVPPSGVSSLPSPSMATPQQVPSSAAPAAAMPQGTGFSSFSQSLGAPARVQEQLTSAQIHQLGSVSRVPSNNSTHSPAKGTLQGPGTPPTGPLPSIPVSRTRSDASQSTEAGGSHHLHTQFTQSHPAAARSQSLQSIAPATLAAPMYSSAHNFSSTSRASHESNTATHQHTVLPTHSHSHFHSQSLSQSQPSSSSRPYSAAENAFFRPVDPSNSPAAAPIPNSTTGVASHQQYPYSHQSSSQNNVHYTPSANAFPQSQSQLQLQHQTMLSSSSQTNPPSSTPTHALSSYPADLNQPSHTASTMLSSQSVHPSPALYHNQHSSSRTHDSSSVYQAQQQQPTTGAAPKPSISQQINSHASYSSARPPDPTSRSTASAIYVTSTRQSGPNLDDTPSSVGLGLGPDSPPLSTNPYPQQPIPPTTAQSMQSKSQNVAAPASASMRPIVQARPPGQNESPTQNPDSPPPLTSSNSSRESHEEILMTPSSLDPGRLRPQNAQASIQRSESVRPEKKRGGLFSLFRSNSAKNKEANEHTETKGHEPRRQMPGPSQRHESVNKLRSTKPAEGETNPIQAESMSMSHHHARQSRMQKRVPPPIAIPPHAIPYRLFSSKSKRYRTMSSASMEALDGTANNTIVGSPTSSRMSPTPSGPMTPPLRDPVEAAQEWRNNEEKVFTNRGTHRRRRPGVTFDLTGDDIPKDGGHYRLVRSSRLHGQRGDLSES